MTRRIVLRPVAEDEIREAHDWYEQRRPGLGGEFVACVDAALEQLVRSPEAHPRVHGDIRRVLVRRFPHGIFYVVESGDIVVLAVFHGRRNPAQWQRRR